MDYDKNQFLTDVFEALVATPGDPLRQLDHAIEDVIAEHVADLRRVAQRHREDIIGMAEERKRTGVMVQTRWRV